MLLQILVDFQRRKITANFAYIRFYGQSSLYSLYYSDDKLKIWTNKIKEYLKNVDVYSYFNKDHYTYAVKNGMKLRKLILCF